MICGPGLDGELTETETLDRCASLHGRRRAFLTAQQVQPFREILEWHPSEATGLLIAAATGKRGIVEVRDAGSQVALTTDSSSVIAIHSEFQAQGTSGTGFSAVAARSTPAGLR
jgi:hypothetical protein